MWPGASFADDFKPGESSRASWGKQKASLWQGQPRTVLASPWGPVAAQRPGNSATENGASSALLGLRERVRSSFGGASREKTRARLILKATEGQSETLRSEDLKRIVAEVREGSDGNWVLQRIRERPVGTNHMVAFKGLVVLHRVLQFCSPHVAADWGVPNDLLDSLVDRWAGQASPSHGSPALRCIQAVVDYSRLLSAKMELMVERDVGRGRFSGSYLFSRDVEEPSDLLQALALLLNLSEKLMPLALYLSASQDWLTDRSPYGRLYMGAIPALLDEAWQLLCAVSVFVRDLLHQVHAAAKHVETSPVQNERPPWLELALHLLQAKPRFTKFHTAMCDFVAHCHQLRVAGFVELAPPYSIPAVPQALLNLFADLGDLVKRYCDRSAQPKRLEAPQLEKVQDRQLSKELQRQQATQSSQQQQYSKKSSQQQKPTAKPSGKALAETGQTAATGSADSISNLSTTADSTAISGDAGNGSAGGSATGNWFPSERVLDALRTVDSLQRSPLLAASCDDDNSDVAGVTAVESDSAPVKSGPAARGYALLESDSELTESQVPTSQAQSAEPEIAAGPKVLGRSPSCSSIEVAAGSTWPSVFFPERTSTGASPLAAAKVGAWQDHTPPTWASAICRQRSGTPSSGGTAAPLFATPLWEGSPANGGASAATPAQAATPILPLPSRTDKDKDGPETPSQQTAGPSPPAAAQLDKVPANPFDLPAAELQKGTATPHPPARGQQPKPGELHFGLRPCGPQPQAPLAWAAPRMAQAPQKAPGGTPAIQAAPGAQVLRAPTASPRAAQKVLEQSSCTAEWEVDHTELQLEELLGTGSTAEVYKAGWHGTDVAVKKLRSGQLSTEFRREIAVLTRLRHPNLVLFMGASTQAPQALIISEFCSGGTVFALLHQRRDLALPWPQRLQIALDVAKGMNFLHRRQVVHRDLKSLNLLLASAVQSDDDAPAVKVSDFGLSKVFLPDQAKACMTGGAGTYHWMAPEVLSGQAYDEKVDVYSYGICLFELVARRIPYDGSGLEPVSIAVAVSKGRRPDAGVIPQDCPADLRFTMECCWAHRPSGRPGFDTILETLKLVKNLRS